MPADTANASLWANADVYVGASLSAVVPATVGTAFGATWNLVGLLDGEAGFAHSRDEESDDFFAWGGILVRTSRRNFKSTVKFTALENNTTTRSLLWPGSTDTSLVVPTPVPVLLALETREGDAVRRMITASYAIVTVDGDIVDSEADLTKYEMLATIYPTAAGELWTVQKTAAAVASIAVTPDTASIAVAGTVQLVATATYGDGSTAVVTTSAAWTTSNAARATVGAATGLVTGVAAGAAATITATLGAVSDTSAVTVTA
jgi:hypothetical protein